LCRSNKQSTKNKGKTWSRGTNSRLPFGVNVNLNLSIIIINPYVNQAGNETDGDGIQLNLQIREMCKKYHQPHGPALATLNVSVRNGRPNDVAKRCKELLGFLKDQVLPKTLKLVNLKKIKDMKDEERNELGGNWLSCIRPGKTMKRFVARISPFLAYLMFLLAFLFREGKLARVSLWIF